MEEPRENNLKSGISDLEKVFQEYKSKLEHAEREAEEIVKLAWQKAENIIVEKQREAQQTADGITQRAQQEAERTVQAAQSRAAEIEKEANERARKDAKDRTRREAERVIAETQQAAEKQSAEIVERARKEAESIFKEAKDTIQAQLQEKSEYVIVEAKEKAKKLDRDAISRADETGKLIAEASHKAEQVLERFKTQLHAELAGLTTALGKARDNLEMTSVLDNNQGATAPAQHAFDGRRELNIVPPYSSLQIKKLTEFLKKIPSVKLDGEAATEEEFSIYLNLAKPIPLLNLLQGLSLVESSDIRGDTIRLKLKAGSNGSS